MISRETGEIIFDKKQLTKDEDIPRLYNYDGTRFPIQSTMGTFELDDQGLPIIENGKDKQGRLVNEKGYLTDEEGNVVDNDGNRIFDKKHLGPGGEIPKILPFAKFNIYEVCGDLEKSPNGNPQLMNDTENGGFMDKRGRKVNKQGYLIDDDGNIVDQ